MGCKMGQVVARRPLVTCADESALRGGICPETSSSNLGVYFGTAVAVRHCFDLRLLSHYLYDHALVTLPVELSVKDALPCSEVEFARRDGNDDFVMDE